MPLTPALGRSKSDCHDFKLESETVSSSQNKRNIVSVRGLIKKKKRCSLYKWNTLRSISETNIKVERGELCLLTSIQAPCPTCTFIHRKTYTDSK